MRTNDRKRRRFRLTTHADQMPVPAMIAKYFMLIVIGFSFLYPILKVLTTSLMSPDDLADAHVGWLPSSISFRNYESAVRTLDYGSTLLYTLLLVCGPTLLQMMTCSFAGYAFARFEFPGKRLWMSLLLVSYMLPFQITMIPLYVQFNHLRMIGSVGAFLVPAALGQGLQGALCVLVFYQFYLQLHPSLIDAARIDGAGQATTYIKVAVPLSSPAVIVTAVFSVVWYWNETDLARLYLGFGRQASKNGLTTMMLRLEDFVNMYQKLFDHSGATIDPLNDGIFYAGIILVIAPVLLFYLLIQRWFMESVESSGITGE